jgi:hypothetical protein
MALSTFGLPGAANDWSSQKKSAIASNLVSRYQNTPPEIKRLGAQFFPTWQEDAGNLSSRLGHSGTAHGAAILAHLSPTTEADANRMMAQQVMHLNTAQTAHVHAAAELDTQRKQIASQRKVDPMADRAYNDMTRQIKEHRTKAGLHLTPLGLQASGAISQALKVRDGHYDADPLASLGGLKREDFGRTIASGGTTERQTIDTHYHDASVNRLDIPYDANRGLQAKGRYEGLQESAGMAFKRLQERGELHPEFNKPNDMMAAIWHDQQQRKMKISPDARAGRKAAETRNQTFLQAANAHLWNPAAQGLRPIGSQILGK